MKKSRIPDEIFDKSGLVSTVRIVIVWVAILTLISFCLHTDSIWYKFFCFIFVGVLQYHLNILGHEGIHYSLYRSRSCNDLVSLWFLHAPQGAPLYALRENHFNHHAHLGRDKDLDKQYYLLSNIDKKSNLVLWFVGSFFGFMTFHVVYKLIFKKKSVRREKKKTSYISNLFAIVVMQIFLVAFFYLLGGSFFDYVAFWIFPIFTVMFGCNVARSCLEHAIVDSGVGESSNRLFSFQSNVVERFFLSPYNMNFHAEHHMYPSVPCSNLPALSGMLRKENMAIRLYSSYWKKFSELLSGLT